MLLITRREGEAIVVNGTMEVRILEIRGGRVKLGFEYPPGNTVFREELFTKIQAENVAAAKAAAPLTSSPDSRIQAVFAKLGTAPARTGDNKKDVPHDHAKPGYDQTDPDHERPNHEQD